VAGPRPDLLEEGGLGHTSKGKRGKGGKKKGKREERGEKRGEGKGKGCLLFI